MTNLNNLKKEQDSKGQGFISQKTAFETGKKRLDRRSIVPVAQAEFKEARDEIYQRSDGGADWIQWLVAELNSFRTTRTNKDVTQCYLILVGKNLGWCQKACKKSRMLWKFRVKVLKNNNWKPKKQFKKWERIVRREKPKFNRKIQHKNLWGKLQLGLAVVFFYCKWPSAKVCKKTWQKTGIRYCLQKQNA